MGATTASPLNIQSHIERIERAQEETGRFIAEQHALTAKLMKLSCHLPRDLDRADFLVPLFLVVIANGITGAIAASVAFWL